MGREGVEVMVDREAVERAFSQITTLSQHTKLLTEAESLTEFNAMSSEFISRLDRIISTAENARTIC
jgi:hypothetical protein